MQSVLSSQAHSNTSQGSGSVEILGVRVCKMRMADVLEYCEQHIDQRRPVQLGMVNAAKLVKCRSDAELCQSVQESDIILADGLPVVWLSRLMGNPLPERVAGIDIMYRLLERASDRHYGVYFLGARCEVVQRVAEITRRDYPGVRVCGYRDGYFAEADEEQVADDIRNSASDILFVAMTSPRKETFMQRWGTHMQVPVCHGVGGSFDVMAGVTKRAPLWMQRCGLEWLYRVVQEPGRMWKRYLVTNSIFMWLSLAQIGACRLRSRDRG